MMAAMLSGLMATPVLAQDARAELGEAYEQNQKALHDLVQGLSEAQWNFKPAADRWSIAEIVEHITINEQFVTELVHGDLEDMAVTSESKAQAEAIQTQVSTTLQDRSQKFQAPDFALPTGRWAGGEEVMTQFDKARGGMIHFLGMADWDLRSKGAMHPVLQTQVDAEVWAVIVVEHCKRHMDQIREVMHSDGYPSM
jgi:hypothetical protein